MAEKHFLEQQRYTKGYLIPYLTKHLESFDKKQVRILDIGCAEGGTISTLAEYGFVVDGIEISEARAKIAAANLPANSKLVVGDITAREEIDLESNYDLIILRDVIEHIEDKKKAFEGMSDLLKTNGHLFMAFPLKYSAYAGHQQTSKTWLRYFPFIALFPSSVIRKVCKMANDSGRTEELLYLKKCALTYRRMRRLTKEGWKIHHIDFFISRPIYQYRFGWRIIKMLNIPLLRELSNGCELILQKKSE